MKENYHNFRTSDDIDMKLEPVTKLTKETKQRQKKFGDDVMLQTVMLLSFFQFVVNLEASRSRIPDA